MWQTIMTQESQQRSVNKIVRDLGKSIFPGFWLP
jgi:hypothetical protein